VRHVLVLLGALFGLGSQASAQPPTEGERVSITTVLIDPRIARDARESTTDAILGLLRAFPTQEWIELCDWSVRLRCRDFEAKDDRIIRSKLEEFVRAQADNTSLDYIPTVQELDEKFFVPSYHGGRRLQRTARRLRGTGRPLTYRVVILARPDVRLDPGPGSERLAQSVSSGQATPACFGERRQDGRTLTRTAPPAEAAALRLLLVLDPAPGEGSPTSDFPGLAEPTQRLFGHMAGAPSTPGASATWHYDGQRALHCPSRPQPSTKTNQTTETLQSFPLSRGSGQCFVDDGVPIERPRLSCAGLPPVGSPPVATPSTPPSPTGQGPPMQAAPRGAAPSPPGSAPGPTVAELVPSQPTSLPVPTPSPRDPGQAGQAVAPAPATSPLGPAVTRPPPATGLRRVVHFDGTIVINPTAPGLRGEPWVARQGNDFRVVRQGVVHGNVPVLWVKSNLSDRAECPPQPKLKGRLTLPDARVAYDIDVILLLCPIDGEREIRLPPPPA
jgi:hypothetical protein